MRESELEARLKSLDRVTYWFPPLAIVLLCVTYVLWPDFYLGFLVERSIREYQAVESLTLVLAFSATVVLFQSTVAFRKLQSQNGMTDIIRSGAWITGTLFLATCFFAGEEMNWGQTFTHWGVPEPLKPYEANIHNHVAFPITVMRVGDLFLLIFFILLPLLWRYRDRCHLPVGWGPAIPRWPVVFSVLVGNCWEECKYLYLAVFPQTSIAPSEVYLNFLQELNEHKEMLLAFSFLMYGLYTLTHCRFLSSQSHRS